MAKPLTMDARFQVKYAWKPIKQVARISDELGGFDFTGAVYWLCKVYAVYNDHHGWIAFIEQQTPENLNRCPHCHGTGKIH